MHAYLQALTGGLLIGLSSLLMLAFIGRITGISGIFAAAISSTRNNTFRWAFLAGLLAGPSLYHLLSATSAPAASDADWPLTIAAGLLVGFGTRLGGGCTSGHAVCGIARLSPRSIAATCAFMFAGFVTVYLTRHLMVA